VRPWDLHYRWRPLWSVSIQARTGWLVLAFLLK
jgi:hypothetical protein